MRQAMCLCSTIHELAGSYDDRKAMLLASDLNKHLAEIHTILAKSKSLHRNVHWQLAPSNQRTRKILSIQSIDTSKVDQIYDRFKDDLDGFWTCSENQALAEVRRRIACTTVFLRSVLDSERWVSSTVADLVQGMKLSEVRFAGKKYLKIARRLGGLGALFWLPSEVPSSTYERYLNMDDDEAFTHLQSLGRDIANYEAPAQRLILSQLNDPSLRLSHYELFLQHSDILPASDHLLLLITAFGGADVPELLLRSVRGTKGHWSDDGEVQPAAAIDFGLPPLLANSLLHDRWLVELEQRKEVRKCTLEDGSPCYSIRPEFQTYFGTTLTRQTQESLAGIALRLICFATPPCYEGKANWSQHLTSCIWEPLQKATEQHQWIPMSLRTEVIEALLFFSERGLLTTRQPAIERARVLLHRSMPYYYHASVALFESNILRVTGDLDRSDAVIHDFLSNAKQPSNRCEHALAGRLHVSHIENKIARYDKDVASDMYRWEGIQPLSTFEIEVTRRLQGTAAKYFSTIGDFRTARASLEQHLMLNAAGPIRLNTRYLITCKLAEIHCELDEFGKAIDLIRPEMDSIPERKRMERPFRRFALAFAEAHMGLGRLDEADEILGLLAKVEPPELEDINAQTLHMRRLINTARATHERLQYTEALEQWEQALNKMEELTIFRFRHKWIKAILQLSVAHARLQTGDQHGGREAWDAAVEILRGERVEYVLPTLATRWLRKMVDGIHRAQGWSFRVMLPGGRPDVTWP